MGGRIAAKFPSRPFYKASGCGSVRAVRES